MPYHHKKYHMLVWHVLWSWDMSYLKDMLHDHKTCPMIIVVVVWSSAALPAGGCCGPSNRGRCTAYSRTAQRPTVCSRRTQDSGCARAQPRKYKRMRKWSPLQRRWSITTMVGKPSSKEGALKGRSLTRAGLQGDVPPPAIINKSID